MPTATYRQRAVFRGLAQGEELVNSGCPHFQTEATQQSLSVLAQLSETYTHSKILCDKSSEENIKDINSYALDVSIGNNSTEETQILLKYTLD